MKSTLLTPRDMVKIVSGSCHSETYQSPESSLFYFRSCRDLPLFNSFWKFVRQLLMKREVGH
jgi:hypothetical protein